MAGQVGENGVKFNGSERFLNPDLRSWGHSGLKGVLQMPDTIYVLDLQVTGAAQVMVYDDAGIDSIVVNGIYDPPVEISLGWTLLNGRTMMAGAVYFGFDGKWHRFLVNGQVEDASGSNGRDSVLGNEFSNHLMGDRSTAGAGGDDTLRGGSGNDLMQGGSGSDRVFGDADNDRLYGNDGADSLYGGTGADTLEGGAGADELSGGGSVGDTLSYAAATAGVQVYLTFGATTTARGGEAEGDQIDGFLNVIGSRLNDRITDTLGQTVAGGGNDNIFFGNGGRDKLVLGGGNDAAYGGTDNDMVLGMLGNDSLFGGSGKDWIVGGYGQDILSGGAGADRFSFKSPADSSADPALCDRITDFSSAERDRIDLRAFDADRSTVGNQAFTLIDGAFTGTAGELRLTVSGDDLLISADVLGNGMPNFAVLVLNTTTLTEADFIL